MKLAIAVIAAGLCASFAASAQDVLCSHTARQMCVLKGTLRSTIVARCASKDARAKFLHEGACEGGDMCSMLYKPVCAIDPKTRQQKTYSGICVSEHDNAQVIYNAECKAP